MHHLLDLLTKLPSQDSVDLCRNFVVGARDFDLNLVILVFVLVGNVRERVCSRGCFSVDFRVKIKYELELVKVNG